MLVAFTYWKNEKNNEVLYHEATHWIQHLAENQKQTQFVFLTNYNNSNSVNFSENTQVKLISNSIKLGKKLVELIQLKKIIKELKPDVIVHFSNLFNLKLEIPQIDFLQHQPTKKEALHLLNAQKIVVSSNSFKKELEQQFLLKEDTIEVFLPKPSKTFQPLSFNETTTIKDGYTDGREYFLLIIEDDNHEQFIITLKAFAQFKKWQKSSMKLIVMSRFSQLSSYNKEKLYTYKFKEDVLVVENIIELQYAKLLASAYASIYSTNLIQQNLSILEILQTGCPLITDEVESTKEIMKDASLYCNIKDVDTLSTQLQSIYKDENLRTKLINKAKPIAETHLKSNSIDKFWQIIQKAIQV